jgi:predicted transcriptional regulator
MIALGRLAPREREVAQIVYARGEASAAEICGALPAPLSNAAVRTMLRRLEAKGVVRRRREGKRDLYAPAATDRSAREAALHWVSRHYFGGSLAETASAVAALAKADARRRLNRAQAA